ncbi:fructose-bisphosphate aldolase-lysine N-methyltransferase, chloroplastic [Silene latifolia]|uniref:fructose-bisphosphate aldolase-lysine N-methyltransferase, chloroplastic n=1 Tax=Silene latifolia TaxID=37657 RepID=UPI003D76B782
MEVSYQPSISEDDDGLLVFKVPEDDPLFEKKTKLIKDKGLCASDRLCFDLAEIPDSIDNNLKVLLQIARIIHLNDIELYFVSTSVNSAEEWYSPRNELEALNFVLSQVDLRTKISDPETKSSLKNVRDAIIKRIETFGEKNSVETRIVNGASDNEKRLIKWAEKCGVKSKVEIAYVEGAGRGALAREDLGVGDIALEIPISVVISEDLVYESDMIHILEDIDGISAETMLLIWSMRERHNIKSNYKLYFDALPEEFNTGLSFGLDALMALDETLVSEELFQAKEHLRLRYDEMFPALCTAFPDIFPPEYYTWEQYLWACELWYSNSMRIMLPDGKLRTCLIPVAGFLNHSVCPHILHYGKVDSATNTLKFRLSRPCKKGEQCYLSYGNLSSSHLLTFYGFLPQEDNPYDVIPLDIEAAEDSSSEGAYIESDNTTHMVRGTWHSVNQGLFNYGLPSAMLEHLRKVSYPGLRTMTLLQESLENEMKVLGDLYMIFDNMMDKLGGSEMDDRENMQWDVQLAIKCKDLQRNIVSSILTACLAGRKMVEHELMKCISEDVLG